MTEIEYRIEHFEKNCRELLGKRIFLYGTGKNTEELLAAFSGSFCFCGIIDPDITDSDSKRSTNKYQLPVYSFEEAIAEKPEVIMLAAQMYSAEKIYQRINRECIENGIDIYDMYGFDQVRLHEEYHGHTYQDISGWEKLTEGYDVVSFELMDTVIARDMFHSKDEKIRPVMKQLISRLQKKGVIIIGIASDEFDPERYTELLLSDECGESLFNRIIKREHKERFFRDIRDSFQGKKILHIGSSLLEDFIIPRLCGVDAYHMVFFDNSILLGFREGRKNSSLSDKQEFRFREIDNCKVILFDVFDTLIERTVSSFEAVFIITGEKALEQHIFTDRSQVQIFAETRSCVQNGTDGLDRMYEMINRKMHLTEKQLEQLMQFELEIEKECIQKRKEGFELFDYAVSQNKQIYLVSDMYLSSKQLDNLLMQCGIKGYEKIFVSCEYGLTKEEGMFQLVREAVKADPEEMLHIGDDLEKDCLSAHRQGLRYLWLPSSKNANYGNYYAYGFLAMAPVIHGWMKWFINAIKNDKIEKIFFSSRDGFILERIYQLIKPEVCPDSVYFYTSRRAAFLPLSDKLSAVGYIADMAKDLSTDYIMRQFYDLSDIENEDTLQDAFQKNISRIRENAIKAGKRQIIYWERCGLIKGKKYAFVDFVASGTVQRLLSESGTFELKGYYFGLNDTDIKTDDKECFIKGDTEEEKSFLSRYLEMEYFMTSPEPSLKGYNDEGHPVFAAETRSDEELKAIDLVHRGIIDYFTYCKDPAIGPDPQRACSLYNNYADLIPEQIYYDDWTGTWIKNEKEDIKND